MAYQPKSYRKFLAGTVTAAVVATAVAPAASAAFVDVPATDVHAVNIDTAVEKGLINGFADGTFKPYQDITRGQVAKILARYLGDVDTTGTEQFTDVAASADAELAEAALVVRAKGVFTGSNGNLNFSKPITRQEMATVLVRLFDLKDTEGEANVTDLDKAWDTHRANISILAENGITNVATFNPLGNVKRGQFATFLVRAIDGPIVSEQSIVSVTALDETNKYLSIQFAQPVSSLDPSDITITNTKKGDRHGVAEVTLSADKKTATVELFENTEEDLVLQENTEYTVAANVNGKVVEGTFYDAAFSEARVIDVNLEDKEFTIADNNTGEEKVIKVVGDTEFDFQAALGELARVWYNDDDELVSYKIDNPTAVYSAIEITDTDEIKLLSSGKKVDISETNYKVNGDSDAAKFKFYLNGEDVTNVSTTDDTATIYSSLVDNKINYAKVGYDKAGKVEYISAYSLNQFLIVDSVDGDDVVGVTGNGTDGSFKAKDATIVKDGKLITLEDLQEGDLLLFNKKADDEDGYAVVYNNTVTGAIDEVFEDKIEVSGKRYTFKRSGGTLDAFTLTGSELPADNETSSYTHSYAVFINEDGETEEIKDADKAEELQAAGEVTLYLDPAGNLVYVKGDTADVAQNRVSAILTDSIKVDEDFQTPYAKIEAVLEDGEEKLYNINLHSLDKIHINGVALEIEDASPDKDEFVPSINTTDDTIRLTRGSGTPSTGVPTNATIDIDLYAAGTLVELHLDDDGNVDEIEFFDPSIILTDVTTEEGRVINYTGAVLEAGDDYLDGKKLTSGTVVYDTTDGTDADDVTVTTWGEYQGSDIQKVDYVYDDDNEVVAIVIKETTTQDAVYESAVVVDRAYNKDGHVVEVKAYVDGEIKTFDVDEAEVRIDKGEVVVLEFDDNNEELVRDIFTTVENNLIEDLDGDPDTVTATDLTADDFIVTTALDVSSVNIGTRTVVTSGDTFKLISGGLVLDITDSGDISVEALSDVQDTDKYEIVYISLDEENANFANFIVIRERD